MMSSMKGRTQAVQLCGAGLLWRPRAAACRCSRAALVVATSILLVGPAVAAAPLRGGRAATAELIAEGEVPAGPDRLTLLRSAAEPHADDIHNEPHADDTHEEPHADDTHNEPHAVTGSEGHHGRNRDRQSVFHIHASELDREIFWMIITGMLAFTIVIDRLQWLATEAAGTNRCNVMFLNRCIGELMMFGVVAISVFLFSQLSDMDEHTKHLFEFVDLLCSFAACALILMGIVLFCLRSRLEDDRKQFTQDEANAVMEKLKAATSMGDVDKATWKHLKFAVMRAEFFASQNLSPKAFSYTFYEIESLNQDICDLININWITWVATTIMAFCILVARWMLGSAMESHDELHPHILAFCILTWLTWTCCLGLAILVHMRHRQFTSKLGLGSVEGARAALDDAMGIQKTFDSGKPAAPAKLVTEEDRKAFTSTWEMQLIQIFALCLCFMLGFYVMHVQYNIRIQDLGMLWHLCFLIPLITALFVLVPFAIKEHSTVQSFCAPQQDVMESVKEQVAESRHDLHFIRKQLEEAASTAGQGGDNAEKWVLAQVQKADEALKGGKDSGVITGSEFPKALKLMGVAMSKERAGRLFQRLTHGGDEITYAGLVTTIFSPEKVDSARLTFA